jgi:uncharacterized protein (DUF2461 family)
MPEPDVLGAIRERIRVHPDRFLQMTQALAERGLQLDAMDTLSRMPKGFEDLAGAPFAAALKLKSFLVRRAITAKEAQSPALVSLITRLAGDALPLLQFGWAAIDEVRSS